MDFALNHIELILALLWYILSAIASELSLPKEDSPLWYKIVFHSIQVITGALARSRAGKVK